MSPIEYNNYYTFIRLKIYEIKYLPCFLNLEYTDIWFNKLATLTSFLYSYQRHTKSDPWRITMLS